MRRSWARRAAALLCVVIVLFMAMTLSVSPSSHNHDVSAILTTLWILFALVVIVLLRPGALRHDEQPASLRSLAPFRAPPAPLALA